MQPQEFDEWKKDIDHADQTALKTYVNGSFLRSLFRMSQHIDSVGQKISYLTSAIKRADESSTELAEALNKLTFWGVLITIAGVITVWLQFFYEHQLWPFTQ